MERASQTSVSLSSVCPLWHVDDKLQYIIYHNIFKKTIVLYYIILKYPYIIIYIYNVYIYICIHDSVPQPVSPKTSPGIQSLMVSPTSMGCRGGFWAMDGCHAVEQ